MNNNNDQEYMLNEQNQKFYNTFDADERKDLDKLAQDIFDNVESFFDKYDGLGCSYSDLIELISELAVKKSFELQPSKDEDMLEHVFIFSLWNYAKASLKNF